MPGDGGALRNRRTPDGSAGSDAETLTEPLLEPPVARTSYGATDGDGDGDGDDDASAPSTSAAKKRTTSSILSAIAAWFQNLFASIGLCSRRRKPLTKTQRERLRALIDRAAIPYDATNVAHAESLRDLWKVAFPMRDLPGMKCEEWKEMGWQGVDPATDFRAGGLLSLQNLVWFAKKQNKVFKRLMRKTDGARSDWEYPFAACGVNVTHALVELLQLRDDTKKTKTSSSSNAEEEEDAAGDDASSSVPKRTTAAAAAFAELLATDPDAFENMYVTFFETLDAEWLSQEATYMEFNVVMKATTKKVKAALEKVGRRRDGGSVARVRQKLGLQ
jgi:hypothetical protein